MQRRFQDPLSNLKSLAREANQSTKKPQPTKQEKPFLFFFSLFFNKKVRVQLRVTVSKLPTVLHLPQQEGGDKRKGRPTKLFLNFFFFLPFFSPLSLK